MFPPSDPMPAIAISLSFYGLIEQGPSRGAEQISDPSKELEGLESFDQSTPARQKPNDLRALTIIHHSSARCMPIPDA